MKKAFTIFTVSIISWSNLVMAQAPNWQWAKSIGGIDLDGGISIVADASGNVYSTGTFIGTSDFDPGPGIFNLSSIGSLDFFISKLDSSGNFLWAKSIGGIGATIESYSIAIDANGNVYLTGALYGTADFDPDTGIFNLTSAASHDIFISKYDSWGNFVWAKVIGGTEMDYGNAIAVDAANNVYATGVFKGTVDFDPDSLINFNLTSAGNFDIFISKLDSSGNFVWAKTIGGTDDDEGRSITIDSYDNVYTTGTFNGTSDFNPNSSGSYNLTSGGYEDVFISKLNSMGNFIWARAFSGTYPEIGWSLAVDGSGNVYTTGGFYGTTDFDPDSTANYNLTSFLIGYWDIFIAKLDSSGNFVWAKRMGGTEDDLGISIAIDASGNVYTLGRFDGTVDFNPGPGTYNLTSVGTADIFISKLNNSGNFVWAKAFGGTGWDIGKSISLDANNNIYVTGWFTSSAIYFDLFSLTNTDITSPYTSDMFIAKLGAINTGIEYLINNDNVSVYPNPSTSHFTISLPSNNKKTEVTITDITGKIIYTTTITNSEKIEVNTKDFSAGVYLVQIQIGDFIETKKLIVAK